MKKLSLPLGIKIIAVVVLTELSLKVFLGRFHIYLESTSPIIDTLLHISLLAIILTAVITYALRPIRQMLKKIDKIRNGDLTTRLNIYSNDEIGIISRQINHMVEGLQTSYKNVEDSKKLLTTITDGLDEEIILINRDFKILWVNKKTKETNGFSENEIIGNACYKVTHHLNAPCQAPADICPINEALKTGKSMNVTHRHFDKDNNLFYVEISVYPLKDENGAINRFIHISRDITERMQMIEELKKAKDEIEKYSRNLETIVEQRTQKLIVANKELKNTEAHLIQSEKIAAIGKLAGGVAHEINNPLTVILNNCNILQLLLQEKKHVPPEIDDALKSIENAVSKCKRITKSLLEFSHAPADKFEPVSLNELIEKTIRLIEYEAPLNNIIIQKEFQPDLPKIIGNAQLLEQAVFNILSNSRWAIEKKTDKKGGQIILKTHREKNKAILTISDTGIGIPKENLNKIFEAFFTSKAVDEGTGLGLSIVYTIIKKHSGKIEVESEINKGATFKITFPIRS